jgi:branched-chain amino acid transport system ATP-binding protein
MTIELRNVHASYARDVPILNGLDISVGTGEIVTIIGPNGSGKSTLLRSLMGFVPHVTGELVVDGQRLSDQRPHKRTLEHGLAYVPQMANVFPPLTVEENLELGGQHLSRGVRRVRMDEMYDRYPRLRDRRRQRADALSGGERQTLALGRALMSEPRYLLLDEPSAGLSPLFLTDMFDAIEKISTDRDVSVLLVEQNAAQALAISDRGYVLVLGAVALTAPAGVLLDDPKVRDLYLGGVQADTLNRERGVVL